MKTLLQLLAWAALGLLFYWMMIVGATSHY